MAQDLRDLLKNDKKLNVHKMPKGHEDRFMQLLEKEIPQKSKGSMFWFLRAAASVVIIFSVGIASYQFFKTEEKAAIVNQTKKDQAKEAQIGLGDISPNLKKVEDYYVVNINLELSELQVTDENKQLLDGYLSRLAELNDEYKKLTTELNEVGPNEQTVSALIDNLQLRLQLLYRLKERLKELKNINNGNYENNQV